MAKKRPLDFNYATLEDFATQIRADLLSAYQLVESERASREEVWQESYRAWSVDRTDSDRNYDGLANLYVPQLRKEIETMSRRIYKALFPDDYLSADQSRLENEDLAQVNSMVVRHFYDNQTNIRAFAMPWIKQGVIYGTSPARQFWDKKVNEQFFKERYFLASKEGILEPRVKVVQRPVTIFDAPVLRAEDMFQTYVFPHFAQKPEDIEMVFWNTKVQRWALKKKSESGMCHKYKEIENTDGAGTFDFEQTQERLQQFGQSGEYPVIQNAGWFDLMEIWCNLLLPGEDYPVPCVVEIVNQNFVTRIQRNPYWHQQPPFDWMRFIIPPPGEFYGRGLPEASMALQHSVNDMLNQTMDSATLALNNITIINPAYAPHAESFEVEPRAVWWADPNSVKQMQFPDLSDTGIKNMSVMRGVITEMSDNSPQLPDPIAGKARSTGQAQLAINEWQTDLYTIVEQIGYQALAPMAKKTHMLIQQNASDDTIIRISGKYSGKWVNRVVTPEEILGNFNFKWIPALQIENTAVRTQQMLNYLRIHSSIPPEERPRLNMVNFLIRVMRDGFGVKDVHNLFDIEQANPSVPPEIEHRILDLGGEIKVQRADDDMAHEREHRRYMSKEKDLYRLAMMEKHLIEHQGQAQTKAMEAQQAAMAIQMQQAQMRPPGRPGNPGQIPESTSEEDLERGMRVEQ